MSSENLEVIEPSPQPKKQTDIQKLITVWKIMKDIPTDGEESKNWDRVFYPRYSRTAKSLLLLFGFEHAALCIEFVCNYMDSKDLDYTFETVLKRSDLYREQMGRRK